MFAISVSFIFTQHLLCHTWGWRLKLVGTSLVSTATGVTRWPAFIRCHQAHAEAGRSSSHSQVRPSHSEQRVGSLPDERAARAECQTRLQSTNGRTGSQEAWAGSHRLWGDRCQGFHLTTALPHTEAEAAVTSVTSTHSLICL